MGHMRFASHVVQCQRVQVPTGLDDRHRMCDQRAIVREASIHTHCSATSECRVRVSCDLGVSVDYHFSAKDLRSLADTARNTHQRTYIHILGLSMLYFKDYM